MIQKNKYSQARPKKSDLIIGQNAMLQALTDGRYFNKIFIDVKARGEILNEIKKIAADRVIPISYVPTEKLNGLNIAGHEGIAGIISKIKYYDVQQIIDFVTEKGELPFFLILDGITDIRNIGGICRTAFCCGVHALIVPDKGVGLLNDEAIATSAGALEKLAVCRVKSLESTLELLHLNGIKVLATQMDAPKIFTQEDFTTPLAIIMGSEEKGVHHTLLNAADEVIKIPMKNDFESLNVSVAAGIILYHAFQQRDIQSPS